MSEKNNNKEIDKITGQETTGHEWDGLKELNTPAPRWWIWVFIVTVIWSVGYWIVYPSWPTLTGSGYRGGTVGILDWTQYKKLRDNQKEILDIRENYKEFFKATSFDEILKDKKSYTYAVAGGKAAFRDNCATCHGSGAAGAKGYPNLNDDDWLWGGNVEQIYSSIKYGIRSGHDEGKYSEMPEFAEVLNDEQINELAEYILSLNENNNQSSENTLFADNCAACHGNNGEGIQDLGAPNLRDNIWFYSSGDKSSIISQIKKPKHGIMPAWEDRLDDPTIRMLALYIHSLSASQ
ncbi:cytochrome-c oxidase, cbb3-type subunit III [Candidatus Pelagibacter bacterium nBUS_32]|uniref:cytochrome-c oxidase, cbb3-type subunit III n=1 Tax=Candidatus Pelagibacter bacterium nBUS_32 TaxID=3374192 RepID=UPI003EB9091B